LHNICSNWNVPIARWAVWDSARQESDFPLPDELAFIDPMLRRRLSLLAKMALKVANDCAHDLPKVRFVYASRHGELTRTTTMLDNLAADEDLSPTAFSTSVLNASAGLFSILRHDTAPAIAVSAAAESFGYGLMEASLQLAAEPQLPVLFVYADEPAPCVYGQMEPKDSSAHAIGMLLHNDATDVIACTSELIGSLAPSNESQSRAFLRCMESTAVSTWRGAEKTWLWSRRVQ
jgi:hypothetical protein